jgi:hypothetical protein
MGLFDGIGKAIGGSFGMGLAGGMNSMGSLMTLGMFNSNDTGTSPYMGGNTDITRFGNAPGSSALSSMLGSMPQFQNITPGSVNAASVTAPGSTYTSSGPYKQDAYQAKDMSKTDLPQYDAMRERLNSQYSQQQSQAQDSLDRQFAAAGGGPGNGAQAKQTENLATGIAQQKGNDLLGVNAQEAQTRTALQQQEQERAYQSGEAQKGYGFQAQQADIGRQFQAGQTAAQMGLQAGMFNAGNQMQAGMFNAQQGMDAQKFNQQMGMQQSQFKFGAQSSIDQMNLQYQQAQQEAINNEFNKALSQYQAQHSGGLLGGGGFLGLGF